MHGLTGSQEPHNWRTEELLHVGDDLRRQREASARLDQDVAPGGLRGWIGRHVIGVGQAVAGEAPRRSPCPDLPVAKYGSDERRPSRQPQKAL